MGGRDFRALLSGEPCWDRSTQEIYERHGEALQDRMLQNREEVIELCRLIESRGVRSYLEIGIWTGRLVTTLHRLFDFDLVAACDHRYAERFDLPIHLPPGLRFFDGDSHSEAFHHFRAALGAVDLVLIDANHSYHAIRRDFEINRRYPHRFLALHDITGATRHTAGVRKLWQEIDEGHKLEIVRPHSELGLDRSTMGIGIWSESEVL